jgi:hypothetical protein
VKQQDREATAGLDRRSARRCPDPLLSQIRCACSLPECHWPISN